MDYNRPYCPNATSRYFQKLTKCVYIIIATNFWFEDVNLPDIFVKRYNFVSKFFEAVIIVFVATGFGAIYTQQNLTDKQSTDVLMKCIANVLVYTMYGFTVYNQETIKELLFSLTVVLKEMYNDTTVDRMMKKTRMYLAGLMLVGCGTIITYGIEGAVYALTTNATFTTVIPIWPDIEDRRHIAGFARILIYITWLLFFAHVMAIYSLIICISICLGFQFSSLCEYFLSLDNIFLGDDSQGDKENRYEEALKVGIKMHNITLRCVEQLQSSCKMVYSGQILINVCVMLLLMIQMMQSNRSLMEMTTIVFMATTVLVTSGLFIWSAGDITFEAERLPTAMFHSGWHNCRGQSSIRVRKMITFAINEAQQKVVISGLGIIELSYESYVKIVKSSYSVFSVIYTELIET